MGLINFIIKNISISISILDSNSECKSPVIPMPFETMRALAESMLNVLAGERKDKTLIYNFISVTLASMPGKSLRIVMENKKSGFTLDNCFKIITIGNKDDNIY